MANILLLEDDESFGYIMSEYLSMQDFQIDWAKTGEEAVEMIKNKSYDLGILDIMLPGMDGFEFASIISEMTENMPFIFLSAKSLKIDKLKGFKAGAYDYVTKPVEEEILVAKINALLNQFSRKRELPESYQIGSYTFSPTKFKLIHEDEAIKLTARENDLLKMLCDYKGQLLPRSKALKDIWGSTDEFSRKSMDVFVSHLRKYLSKDPSVRIENVHSKGFILHC